MSRRQQTRSDKKRQHFRQSKLSKRTAPRTAAEYSARSPEFQERWNRVAHVIAKMRADGLSLQQASAELEIDPRTVKHWGRSALRKRANGRYTAKASDRFLRVLQILTPDGKQEIAMRNSRQASLLGEYWSAVQHYLETGDEARLETFRGVFITDASGNRIPLLTNRAELNRLGSAGVLRFESLYARSA